MFIYLTREYLFSSELFSFLNDKVFGFTAVNPKACFPLYNIPYLLDDNWTTTKIYISKQIRKEEAISHKGNLSTETRKEP